MGVLVQPSTVAWIDWRCATGRGRRALLSTACGSRCGICFTLTKQPPRFPVRFNHAIALLRPWLFSHGVRGAQALLAQCPPWGHERLALLLIDMLETWPHRLIASPALIQVRPGPCMALCELGGQTPLPCPAEQRIFRLKGPEYVCGLEDAGPSLRFLGWVRSITAPSLVRDQLSRRSGLSMPWERTVSVLAVFEVTDWDAQENSDFLQAWYKAVASGGIQPTAWPRCGPQDNAVACNQMPNNTATVATSSLFGNLPSQWWAPFIDCCQGKVHAAPLMGYARAVEYALIMAAAAQTQMEPTAQLLSPEGQAAAKAQGIFFAHDCATGQWQVH